jgi:hypothetical protein
MTTLLKDLVGLFEHHVAIRESVVAQYALAGAQRKRLRKNRSGINARVEFAVLTTRIRACRQRRKQGRIELATGKLGVELRRVDAGKDRAESALDEVRG